jgi:hypothetical protein
MNANERKFEIDLKAKTSDSRLFAFIRGELFFVLSASPRLCG